MKKEINKALYKMETNERLRKMIGYELEELSTSEIEQVMKDFKLEKDCITYIGTCELYLSEKTDNVAWQLLNELTIMNEGY